MDRTDVSSRLRGCRVLLVEDERIIRELLTRMLKALGVGQVVETSTAEDAWDWLAGGRRETFHVLITDLTLPGISGGTLIEKLRKLPSAAARTLPVIVVTGRTDPDILKQISLNNVSSYLVKPVSPAILRDALEKALWDGAYAPAPASTDGKVEASLR